MEKNSIRRKIFSFAALCFAWFLLAMAMPASNTAKAVDRGTANPCNSISRNTRAATPACQAYRGGEMRALPAAGRNNSGIVRELEDLDEMPNAETGVNLRLDDETFNSGQAGSSTQPVPHFSGLDSPFFISKKGPFQVVDDLILHGMTSVLTGLINEKGPQPFPDLALNDVIFVYQNSENEAYHNKNMSEIHEWNDLTGFFGISDLADINDFINNLSFLEFKAAVENHGDAESGPYVVSSRLSLQDEYEQSCAPLVKKTYVAEKLAGGASAAPVFFDKTAAEAQMRLSDSRMPPGNCGQSIDFPSSLKITVCAETLFDKNQGNNCAEKEMEIPASARPNVDFKMKSASLSPAPAFFGHNLIFNGQVDNIGDSPLRNNPINVTFKLFRDVREETFTDENIVLTENLTIDALNPSTWTLTFNLPADKAKEKLDDINVFQFCVESERMEKSDRWSNNCMAKQFFMSTPALRFSAINSAEIDEPLPVRKGSEDNPAAKITFTNISPFSTDLSKIYFSAADGNISLKHLQNIKLFDSSGSTQIGFTVSNPDDAEGANFFNTNINLGPGSSTTLMFKTGIKNDAPNGEFRFGIIKDRNVEIADSYYSLYYEISGAPALGPRLAVISLTASAAAADIRSSLASAPLLIFTRASTGAISTGQNQELLKFKVRAQNGPLTLRNLTIEKQLNAPNDLFSNFRLVDSSGIIVGNAEIDGIPTFLYIQVADINRQINERDNEFTLMGTVECTEVIPSQRAVKFALNYARGETESGVLIDVYPTIDSGNDKTAPGCPVLTISREPIPVSASPLPSAGAVFENVSLVQFTASSQNGTSTLTDVTFNGFRIPTPTRPSWVPAGARSAYNLSISNINLFEDTGTALIRIGTGTLNSRFNINVSSLNSAVPRDSEKHYKLSGNICSHDAGMVYADYKITTPTQFTVAESNVTKRVHPPFLYGGKHIAPCADEPKVQTYCGYGYYPNPAGVRLDWNSFYSNREHRVIIDNDDDIENGAWYQDFTGTTTADIRLNQFSYYGSPSPAGGLALDHTRSYKIKILYEEYGLFSNTAEFTPLPCPPPAPHAENVCITAYSRTTNSTRQINAATISWLNAGIGSYYGYYVELDNDSNWSNGYIWKYVPQAPDRVFLRNILPGVFNQYEIASPSIGEDFTPGQRYYIRIRYIKNDDSEAVSSVFSFLAGNSCAIGYAQPPKNIAGARDASKTNTLNPHLLGSPPASMAQAAAETQKTDSLILGINWAPAALAAAPPPPAPPSLSRREIYGSLNASAAGADAAETPLAVLDDLAVFGNNSDGADGNIYMNGFVYVNGTMTTKSVITADKGEFGSLKAYSPVYTKNLNVRNNISLTGSLTGSAIGGFYRNSANTSYDATMGNALTAETKCDSQDILISCSGGLSDLPINPSANYKFDQAAVASDGNCWAKAAINGDRTSSNGLKIQAQATCFSPSGGQDHELIQPSP